MVCQSGDLHAPESRLSFIGIAKEVVREEHVNLVNEQDLRSRVLLSLDLDFFLWVSQDEVEDNVSELAILIDIKLADLVESLVLDELS
jgi:hypothetical protein